MGSFDLKVKETRLLLQEPLIAESSTTDTTARVLSMGILWLRVQHGRWRVFRLQLATSGAFNHFKRDPAHVNTAVLKLEFNLNNGNFEI